LQFLDCRDSFRPLLPVQVVALEDVIDLGVAVPGEDADVLLRTPEANRRVTAVPRKSLNVTWRWTFPALAAFCHDERNPLAVHGLPSLERHIGPMSRRSVSSTTLSSGAIGTSRTSACARGVAPCVD